MALKRLKQDPNVMILPADKGRGEVVMNSQDYRDKAAAMLSDNTTYKPLKKDPTSKYSSQVVRKLQELKFQSAEIDEAQYRRLYPTGCVVPRFYGLPKIHKTNLPLRPIVVSRGCVTYQIAKLVADILSPLVTWNPYCLKNSAELVDVLSSVVLDEDDIMVSFDVTALFISVPVDHSLEVVRGLLSQDDTLPCRTCLSVTHVIELLELCLRSTYFAYEGQMFSQVEGAAMGSPVSPIVTNIFMQWFEETALDTFPYEITLWKRYVDDTIVVLMDKLLEDFTAHINPIHPAICFTREEEEVGVIAVLDAKITRKEDR